MTEAEAEAKREELYAQLNILNKRINAARYWRGQTPPKLGLERSKLRDAIKQLEMEVARYGTEDRKAN